MTFRRPNWYLVAGFTVASCLGMAGVGYSQFTSYNDRTHAGLEGNWQSCRETDGQYAERVYDGKLPGVGPFEFHMGPYHEFALFRGQRQEHRDHASSENLLHPYNVGMSGTFARHVWNVSGLSIEVALAGGSREDCESWFVTLRPTLHATSSH